MPELLLELLSEEIPARMQPRAAADLERAVNKALLDAGFLPEGVKAFAGPRRLTLVAAGLPARQPDRREEKKGPRVGAPDKAVEGFLKSAGLSSLDQCETREDKKGAYYVAVVEEKGRETAAVIADVLPEILRGFPWPKSMRWGDGDFRWVRPLHRILCAFDGEIVSFEAGGVASGDTTLGHRFMAPGEIRARSFEPYAAALKAAKVILDAEERKALIAGEAKTLCEAQGLELVEDEGLLNEVSGLAEWPVPMIGAFDEKFLALPDEALTASMRGHQKYFSVRDPKTGRLANRFVYVANLEAPDAGKAMRAGYERVLTARLSDAWYLYRQDLKTPLKDRLADLDRVTFFEGLGSVGDKARRVAALAREIAPNIKINAVGADPQLAEEAALLAKCDLVSQMVFEFPELQGAMGRYYYLAQAGVSSPVYGGGVAEGDGGGGVIRPPQSASRTAPPPAGEQNACAIADAIRDHYKPQGADDDVPTAPVTVAVALADKIDTLTAFWAIGKKPTGSSDPFALRRAALGVIRLLLEKPNSITLGDYLKALSVRIPLLPYLRWSALKKLSLVSNDVNLDVAALREPLLRLSVPSPTIREIARLTSPSLNIKGRVEQKAQELLEVGADVLAFFHDRLKVYLRDKGHRHDHIDAVLTKADGSPEDDLVLIVRKLEALEVFLKTDDGANLAAGFKRAANILKAEEKKDALPGAAALSESALVEPEEKALFAALDAAEARAKAAVAAEKFEDAMAALASLRAPIDAFFEKVTVNAGDPALRANRLALLARFRAATAEVADLSKLEG